MLRALPHPLRRLRRSERGQALVEFALVLPLLCLVLFAITGFGLLFYKYIDLTSATRDGARKATVSRENLNAPAAIRTAIANATSGVDDANTTVTITPAQPWKIGDSVRVKVTYPYSLDVMGAVLWSGPMTAESVARIE